MTACRVHSVAHTEAVSRGPSGQSVRCAENPSEGISILESHRLTTPYEARRAPSDPPVEMPRPGGVVQAAAALVEYLFVIRVFFRHGR